jgi:hypothetical protein
MKGDEDLILVVFIPVRDLALINRGLEDELHESRNVFPPLDARILSGPVLHAVDSDVVNLAANIQ